MNPKEQISRHPKRSDIGVLVLRLQRINKDLTRLILNLNSYVCEPSTLQLYERIQSLRSSIQKLQEENRALQEQIEERQLEPEQQQPRISLQMEAYKNLELAVLEYIGMAKMHS